MTDKKVRGLTTRMLKDGASEREVRTALIEAGETRKSAIGKIRAVRCCGLGGANVFDEQKRDRDAARRASILHLVDLKRAGHSPTVTELRLRTDLDTPTRYVPTVVSSSYVGSSSAMCAELGS